MTAVMVEFPGGSGPLTVEDLERMPDDGRRYELVDGVLFVSPAPGTRHQKVVLRLGALLDAVCPIDLEVLTAPFAVRSAIHTEVQPDVLVARYGDLTEKLLPVAPLLAVEVLPPSTAVIDANVKKDAYRKMGVLNYWIIDPLDAWLTVFELDESRNYVQVAEVKGEDVFEVRHPFPARIVVAELLGKWWNRP
ncbi:Uma2 family endonuclease [Kibdelosporangium philippinense]|uniref:Uma2 family endonuclease n=1 Tax=Kibdelosporangium philippinense TaxID=211113 RepID=A0ABS8ZV56_9PSEU|nr:Uma2 family endonuclease [Kibdelosporangium philippinense]MCE7011586.1 Uma2 family endonuclease [Kibdelosporangium philippinense]